MSKRKNLELKFVIADLNIKTALFFFNFKIKQSKNLLLFFEIAKIKISKTRTKQRLSKV
jgi:hypothetical protein